MSEEEKILKFFRSYFTQSKIKQDFPQKIIKQAEQYEAKSHHKDFLKRFFETLKKSYDPKNPKSIVMPCKRFLFVINKLLGSQVKKEKQSKYNQIITQQIVQYYLYFFEIIFKNSLHQLAVELKMYRMRWVKLISDHAFIKLRYFFYNLGNRKIEYRQQIMNKYKFNLDRGFSSQNMQKIKKIHLKRGLTEKQSNFYLGLDEKDQTKVSATQKQSDKSSQSSSQESQNDDGSPYKKRKPQNTNQSSYNYPSPQYSGNPYHNYPNQSPPYQSIHYQPYSDPRLVRSSYPQNRYPQNFQTIPVNVQYNNQKRSVQRPPLNNNPMIYSPLKSNSTFYPHSNYQNIIQTNRIGSSHEFKQVPEERKSTKIYSGIQKIIKIRAELHKNLVKCRQCGLCFQTGENHQKHMMQHFFTSLQKVNEPELKGKVKKQSKIKLLDMKSWESMQKSVDKQYRFEVVLSQIPQLKGQKLNCYFCNQQLEITFSSKYEDWVLSDTIKINDEGKINLIHYGCYECFKSDQNSSAQN